MPDMLGLTAGDFDAYSAERATSNAFSRPRLEFKQRVLAWAHRLRERLADIQLPLEAVASDEHPNLRNGHRVERQWVRFERTGQVRAEVESAVDLRAPMRSPSSQSDASPHAHLTFVLDSTQLEINAQVHPFAWVDFEAFEHRVNSQANHVVELLGSLPEQFEMGLAEASTVPVSSITSGDLVRILREAQESQRAVWVGWRVPREVALDHAALLDEQLQDALIALVPLYNCFAWSSNDDTTGVRDHVDSLRAQRTRQSQERAAADEQLRRQQERSREDQSKASRERTREKVDYESKRPAPTLDTLFRAKAGTQEPPARKEPAIKKEPKRARPTEAQQPRESTPPIQDRKESHASPRVPVYEEGGVYEAGAKVQVLGGAFSGKLGIIGELDGRGGARVLLGLLSARIPLDQLSPVTEVKGRPPLQSSHRKPGNAKAKK